MTLHHHTAAFFAFFLLAVSLFQGCGASSAKAPALSPTQNHAVDDFRQGSIPDCWLLGPVNALRYTEAGRALFAGLITYHKGYSVVHLATGDYKVRDSEISRKGYSRGDYDVNVIEVAVEHALDDYNRGKLKLPEALRYMDRFGDSVSSLCYGYDDLAVYLLTGIAAGYFRTAAHPEQAEDVLGILERGEACIVTVSTKSPSDLRQATGGTVHIAGYHTYTVVRADADTVTVVNPEDTSLEIVLSRADFLSAFQYVTYCLLA